MHLRTKIAEIADLLTSEEDLEGFKSNASFEKKLSDLITIIRANQKEKPLLQEMRSKLSSFKSLNDGEVKDAIRSFKTEEFQLFLKANGIKVTKTVKDPKAAAIKKTLSILKDLRKNNQ